MLCRRRGVSVLAGCELPHGAGADNRWRSHDKWLRLLTGMSFGRGIGPSGLPCAFRFSVSHMWCRTAAFCPTAPGVTVATPTPACLDDPPWCTRPALCRDIERTMSTRQNKLLWSDLPVHLPLHLASLDRTYRTQGRSYTGSAAANLHLQSYDRWLADPWHSCCSCRTRHLVSA